MSHGLRINFLICLRRCLFAKFMVKPEFGGVKKARAEVEAGVVIEAMERFVSNPKPAIESKVTKK